MKYILGFVFFLLLILNFPQNLPANSEVISCSNRFVTLVNPVRGRDLWSDKSLAPLLAQYNDSAKYNNPATWLLQYDALIDGEVANVVKNFEVKGEKGIFIEVSKKLAEDAGIEFNQSVRWSHPGVVFLSAYSQSDRKRLIDTSYENFKSTFGYYPKSIGAWWIDSYSLSYIKSKFGLESILIVADQKTTDSYGVWGQWWGYPYIPSLTNVLVPTQGKGLDAVVIQWAQRDPVLAFGNDASFSNFSLQANDYVRNGKDTSYFKSLVNTYLDCKNPIGQITIGMETGMEAADFAGEYRNQLRELNSMDNLSFVTMSEFAEKYKSVNPENRKRASIGSWNMDTEGRANPHFGDYIVYNQKLTFGDYFLADESSFLDRNLSTNIAKKSGRVNIALLAIIFISFVQMVRRKKFGVWLSHLFFVLAAYGLLFRSGEIYGWTVYYGLRIENLYLVQSVVYVFSLFFFYLIFKYLEKRFRDIKLFFWTIPLTFGIDGFLNILRFSKIDGQNLLGVLAFRDTITGILFNSREVSFISSWFPIRSHKYFYKFPYEYIGGNPFLYFIVSPVIHVAMGILIGFVLRRVNNTARVIIISLFLVLYLVFLNIILNTDPVKAIPITK